MRTILSEFHIEDMVLRYLLDEKGKVGLQLLPQSAAAGAFLKNGDALEPLVQVKLGGDAYAGGFSQGRTMRNSGTVDKLTFEKQEVEEDHEKRSFTVRTFLKGGRNCSYVHTLCHKGESKALECSVQMRNDGSEAVKVEMLSSFTLGGLSPLEEGLQDGNLVLHRMRSTWAAEGRMVEESLESLHLEPSWQKFSANSMRFGQVGSMPVREYVPFTALEDKKNKSIWAVSLTHASSWQMEVYRKDNSVSLSGGLADREFGHWTKIIAPGESFVTPKAVLTTVAGDGGAKGRKNLVDDAAQRLAGNMRENLTLPEVEKDLPIIFNEFCTSWGEPSQEQILCMGEILRGKGCRYYVIDAGWYSDTGGDWQTDLGEWKPAKTRFPDGMKAVTDTIRSQGMIPGIWFEFEITGKASALFLKKEWMLLRDGEPITSGVRRFLDMRNPKVQEYLHEKVIAFLQEYGFGYLKVDYNETIGMGCDGAESSGEELRQQIEASQQFFDRIREEVPGIVIEVCSSGGHRLVASFLERVSMASFSDAHECDEIPVIAANMHRMILPRQSQIWAVLQAEHPLSKLYYQLTSGMLGRLCISGDVEHLSEVQWKIIKEGICFYQLVSDIIEQGQTRFYGPEIKSYRNLKGWQGIVRRAEDRRSALVLVHSFRECKDTPVMDLPNAIGPDGKETEWKIVNCFHREGIRCLLKEGVLTVTGCEAFDGIALYLTAKN